MKRGIHITCTVCGYMKKPHGRSAPMGPIYCDEERCPGYNQPPFPGCLWPDETEEEFGYPCCDNATEQVPEEPPESAA